MKLNAFVFSAERIFMTTLEKNNKKMKKKVSVLVASGDDGAGQFATCPVDPRLPVDVSGGAVEGTETSCPFDKEECNCASFSMEVQG